MVGPIQSNPFGVSITQIRSTGWWRIMLLAINGITWSNSTLLIIEFALTFSSYKPDYATGLTYFIPKSKSYSHSPPQLDQRRSAFKSPPIVWVNKSTWKVNSENGCKDLKKIPFVIILDTILKDYVLLVMIFRKIFC